MSPRGNKPVGRTAKALMVLAVGLALIGIAISIYSYFQRPGPTADPATLPNQVIEHRPVLQ